VVIQPKATSCRSCIAFMGVELGRRITLLGNSGSGKSTLARALGQILDLPVTHLDAVYWKPSWAPRDKAEFLAIHEAITAQPEWIVEGVYTSTYAQRLERCDSVIFLDLPTRLCLARVYGRSLRGRGTSRVDLAEGCPDQLPDWAFLKYVWSFNRHKRPAILEKIQASRDAGKTVLHLQSPRAVRDLLWNVQKSISSL
jgi:adenylate kinase family enzyme